MLDSMAKAKKKSVPIEASKYLAEIGRKGGKKGGRKGLAAMTKEQREIIRAKALAKRRADKA